MTGDGNNVGAIVPAIAVNPQSATLDDGAHQIEARGGTLIRALVKISETKKRSYKERGFNTAPPGFRLEHRYARFLLSLPARLTREMASAGSESIRQPN